MKISNLIIVSFILVGLIGSFAGAIIYYRTSQDMMEEEVKDNLLAVAESRAEHVETYLEQNIERLKLVTSRTKLRNTLKNYNLNFNQTDIDTITRIINDAKEPIDEFERICVLNLEGVVIASTNNDFCGKDVSNKDFFIIGKEKEDIYFVEEDNELKLFVSGPFILEGEIIGVGITVVGSNQLRNIVKDRTGLGETGEVLVAIQEQGEIAFLFERLFEEEASEVKSLVTAEPMKQALFGNELIFRNALDYRDEPVIAASQYIVTGDMGLVTKVDRAEIIEPYKQVIIRDSIIIGLIIVMISLIIGWFISGIISKQIKGLSDRVDEISKGNFKVEIEKSNIQEVNSLAESLGRILKTMKLAVLEKGPLKIEEEEKSQKQEAADSIVAEKLKKYIKISEEEKK